MVFNNKLANREHKKLYDFKKLTICCGIRCCRTSGLYAYLACAVELLILFSCRCSHLKILKICAATAAGFHA